LKNTFYHFGTPNREPLNILVYLLNTLAALIGNSGKGEPYFD